MPRQITSACQRLTDHTRELCPAQFLLLLAVVLSKTAFAASLDVRGEMSFFAELYPKKSIVTMMVVKGTMRTQMTSLMGEPVLNHQIRLDSYPSMYVRLPDERIRSIGELPPEIENAAKKVRFTLIGSLIVGSRNPQYHMKTFIPFDSGASVSPGEGNSFNVPGSPAWGRLFRTDLCGDSFIDEKTARDIAAGFEKKDFWLATADMCSDKLIVDDSALREAISKACSGKGKSNTPEWCPKRPIKEDKSDKDEKAAKTKQEAAAENVAKNGKSGGKPSALDELDQQEIARTTPPANPAKPPEAKPAKELTKPAQPAKDDAGKNEKVLFAEDFKAAKGWQGRYESVESPGCAYLGGANAGIHMGFSPGGPVWRDVSGFTPGQTYTISFEVRTLDPSDAGKASFLIDDQVLQSIRSNGKVAIKFTATKPTHRLKFDWKVQSIAMAPVHITNLGVVAERVKELSKDEKRYLGIWQWNYGDNLTAIVQVKANATGELSATIKTDSRFNSSTLRDFQIGNGVMRGKLVEELADCLGCESFFKERLFTLDIKSMSVKEQLRLRGVMRSENTYSLKHESQ